MRTESFKGVLLSTLMITSIIALAIPLLSSSPVHAALTPRAPIYINGNAGFTPANGVTSGSGTAGDPYIIENWDINAGSANGIEIRNTTAYFIIRNCYVHEGLNYLGIYFYNVTNGLVDNTIMENNAVGIHLEYSDNNIISNNVAENSVYEGIHLQVDSDNNLVSNNICSNNNEIGILLSEFSNNNTLDNNTCSNNDWMGINLYENSADNNTLSNNTCENNGIYGIALYYSDNNTLTKNTCKNNRRSLGYGIDLYYSENNILTINTCENNNYGIVLYSSKNNLTANNICKNNYYGIYLNYYSDNNTLDNNTSKNNNLYGIQLWDSSYNLILRNACSSNGFYGAGFYGIWLGINSNNNLIYHNNFINNATQAYDKGSNFWDNGYPSGGNLWSDYTGVDMDNDGIGDTPYYIPGDNNRDRYPLIWGTGSATFKFENLYRVSLGKDVQLNTGKKLVVKFYKYDNVTLQANSVIDNIVPPENVKENENVLHPLGAPVPPSKYPSGTVQIAKLVLTTDNENEVISTIASFTVHQSDLRIRYIAILLAWFANPDKHSAFRAEVVDILLQWFSAPP